MSPCARQFPQPGMVAEPQRPVHLGDPLEDVRTRRPADRVEPEPGQSSTATRGPRPESVAPSPVFSRARVKESRLYT